MNRRAFLAMLAAAVPAAALVMRKPLEPVKEFPHPDPRDAWRGLRYSKHGESTDIPMGYGMEGGGGAWSIYSIKWDAKLRGAERMMSEQLDRDIFHG